jgi:hypothetical protein
MVFIEGCRRVIKFSEYPDIKDEKMGGLWLKYPRKKTIENGTYKLLKIDGKKAVYQYAVNEIKKYFNVGKLNVELIFDEENKNYGTFIDWEENLCDIGKAMFWTNDNNSMKEIVKILTFDSVIGNNDRTVINILIKKNLQLVAIDEGESFRFYSQPKIKFRKKIKEAIISFVVKNKEWFDGYLDSIIKEKDNIIGVLDSFDEISDDIKKTVADNITDIKKIMYGTVLQM